MIKMQAKTKATEDPAANTPARLIEKLRDPHLTLDERAIEIESLRVSLNSKPVSWVQEFGLAGLTCIVKVYRKSQFSSLSSPFKNQQRI